MDITDEQWSQAVAAVQHIIDDLEDSDNYDNVDYELLLEALLLRCHMGERSEQLYNTLIQITFTSQ